MSQSRRYVIIPAGGTGTRLGLAYPKQLAPFKGGTVLGHAIGLFAGLPTYVPIPAQFEAQFREALADGVTLLHGGKTRYDSVKAAFEALPNPNDDDLILIHDAARPFLDTATLEQAWQAAQTHGAVVYAAPAVDTIKQVSPNGRITATLDRDTIYHAQTPQIFKASVLRAAYAAKPADLVPTDEAGLVEHCGQSVFVFHSTLANRKITHKEDLALLDSFRIGHGYDVHRFDPNRPLYLCGVHIKEGPGLAGHSDADVALHALIDALLGAAARGDIGRWFPDNDPQFAGIQSTILLERVWTDLQSNGYALVNADVTIEAQAPRLAGYMNDMQASIAATLKVNPDQINVKATTTERLGFVGRKEGIAANAVAMLRQEVHA